MSTTSPLPYHVIDAFTDVAFKGNPAAVVLFDVGDDRFDQSDFLLNVSREFNYQETAFLSPLDANDSAPTYRLRWFTPVAEFPLCGHATLASAHALFNFCHTNATTLRFETLSGTLTARKCEDGQIELDFPADSSVIAPMTDAALATEVVECAAACSRSFDGEIVGWAKAGLGWVVELSSKVNLPTSVVDSKPFLRLGGYVIFTQPAPPDAMEDVWSRVLDPVEDQPEDPVTGSAHCILAPYWLDKARSRLPRSLRSPNTDTLLARQVSKRGGTLSALWDRESDRVKLRGRAVIAMRGTLTL